MVRTTRPDSAKTKLNMGAMLRCPISECRTVRFTTPAAAAAIPQIAATVQEYVDVSPTASTVVCSGTNLKVGDTIGILLDDSVASTTLTPYITSAPKILVPLDASTPAIGDDIYRVTASGLFSTTGAGAVWVGKALGVKETNPSNLPAGDYVEISFMQAEV